MLEQMDVSSVDSAAAAAAAWDELELAVRQDDCERVRALFREHPSLDVNRCNVFQSRLIHCAAKHGFAEMVSLLLDLGAELDAKDYGGLRKTALHWAALLGHVQVVEVLMARIEKRAERDASALKILSAMPSAGRSWTEWLTLINLRAAAQEGDEREERREETTEEERKHQLVVLAITKPKWNRRNHAIFPQKFKEGVKELLLCSHRDRVLTEDLIALIASKACYPLSAWL